MRLTELETLKARIAELEKGLAPQTVGCPPFEGRKLDIGCGPNKKEGFFGVDVKQFDGKVDLVLDAGRHAWPWADGSIEEIHSSHMVEHLEWTERVHFFNEAYRVLRAGAKATIIIPHWCSNRWYGDPTHKAPMSEMAWFYLQKAWRLVNAPHADSEITPGPLGYSCDFDASYGFSMAPWMIGRSAEFQQFAFAAYKESAQDMIATLVKTVRG